MWDLGKGNILGTLVSAVDYEAAVHKVIDAARDGRGLAATLVGIPAIMAGVRDTAHRYRLNQFDLVAPSDQTVRRALNRLHGACLATRVEGTALMLAVCRAAAEAGLPVFLYGGRPAALYAVVAALQERIPRLRIAGMEPDRGGWTSRDRAEIARRVRRSGARIVLFSLASERDASLVYEYRELLNLPVMALGQAFEHYAERCGNVPEGPALAPRSPSRYGAGRARLQVPLFLALVALQAARLWQPTPVGAQPAVYEVLYS